jgi:hypothetical protein
VRVNHVVSAATVSIVVAAIYGRIAWGMFVRFDDFRDHLLIAQRLYDTGRPAVPHFLFHALTAALYGTGFFPSLLAAGASVLVGAYGLLGIVTYGVFWWALRDTRASGAWVLAATTFATLIAQPITTVNTYALGYLWPEPYHSPTFATLKPFALAGFAGTAWLLSRRARVSSGLVALFGLVTALGALSKPNFVICMLPSVTVLLAYRRWRHLPLSMEALAIGFYLPAVTILAWQSLFTFNAFSSVDVTYHDSVSWAPLRFMRYWTTGLTAKFVASALFPIVVTTSYWPTARRETMLQLAWLSFGCGALYTYGVTETINWMAGNLVWSGYITLFTLFVATTIFWIRQVVSPEGARSVSRAAICGLVFAMHLASGARLTWLYLTHYGCRADLRLIQFVCN